MFLIVTSVFLFSTVMFTYLVNTRTASLNHSLVKAPQHSIVFIQLMLICWSFLFYASTVTIIMALITLLPLLYSQRKYQSTNQELLTVVAFLMGIFAYYSITTSNVLELFVLLEAVALLILTLLLTKSTLLAHSNRSRAVSYVVINFIGYITLIGLVLLYGSLNFSPTLNISKHNFLDFLLAMYTVIKVGILPVAHLKYTLYRKMRLRYILTITALELALILPLVMHMNFIIQSAYGISLLAVLVLISLPNLKNAVAVSNLKEFLTYSTPLSAVTILLVIFLA